jgi:hypothetical protein
VKSLLESSGTLIPPLAQIKNAIYEVTWNRHRMGESIVFKDVKRGGVYAGIE